MWALRILNGPQAGQIYVLKTGKNKIGRAATSDLQINSAGVSKDHLEIQLAGDIVLIKDLNSSNGTFLNGVRIQAGALKVGDKVNLNQIFFDLIRAASSHPVPAPAAMATAAANSENALVPFPQGAPPESAPAASFKTPLRIQEKIDRYLHEVFLPGVYRLVEVFQFRSVMMGFAIVFIFMVTLLSLFPMNQITSESIKTESRRRAQTVARALANSNEKAVRSGDLSSYSADLVLRDEGITHVYIISKDGSILAPPEMVGLTAKEIVGFVASIKGQNREFSAVLGNGKIAASAPISVFDPDVQQNVAKAHAVVVYDTGSLKFDDGRALGLFVQVLTIALILGIGLFLLMYKLIEYPFRRLHSELDLALREGRDHAQIDLKFPLFQQLMISINSLLTRSQEGRGAGPASSAATRDEEWSNLLQLFGYPGLLLSKDLQILTLNEAFESLTGAQRHLVQGQTIAYLPDQALQKNIEELVKSAHNNTHILHSDKLDISGHLFQLQCQAITVAGEARYYLIGISPVENAEGGAA
ncbi:MAG: FHA domain-containing protein [Pseudobdellovibrionaceae bacterium]